MTDKPGDLFDPTIVPKVSSIKGDPLVHAEKIVRDALDLNAKIRALDNAGLHLPTFYERGSKFGIYDNNVRDTIIARDRDALLARYFKAPETPKDEGVANFFNDVCEWCGYRLKADQACPRPGCRGKRRFE